MIKYLDFFGALSDFMWISNFIANNQKVTDVFHSYSHRDAKTHIFIIVLLILENVLTILSWLILFDILRSAKMIKTKRFDKDSN